MTNMRYEDCLLLLALLCISFCVFPRRMVNVSTDLGASLGYFTIYKGKEVSNKHLLFSVSFQRRTIWWIDMVFYVNTRIQHSLILATLDSVGAVVTAPSRPHIINPFPTHPFRSLAPYRWCPPRKSPPNSVSTRGQLRIRNKDEDGGVQSWWWYGVLHPPAGNLQGQCNLKGGDNRLMTKIPVQGKSALMHSIKVLY